MKKFSSFDLSVATVALLILMVLAYIILRGGNIPLNPTLIEPPPSASNVSVTSPIRIQFDHDVATQANELALRIASAGAAGQLSGALSVQGNTITLTPDTPWAPSTTFTVTLAAGVSGTGGEELTEPLIWRFQTAPRQLLYTSLDASYHEQLYTLELPVDPASGQIAPAASRQLTDLPLGIWDFAVSPDGSRIIYAELKEGGMSDLWMLERGVPEPTFLLSCPNASCSSAAWAPKGQLVVFARRNGDSFGSFGPPRLWLLNMQSGETAQVFTDNQTLGYNPQWSASGNWLSYLSPDLEGVGIYNVNDGRQVQAPTQSGEVGAWHTKRDELLFGVLQQQGDQFWSHLHLIDPEQPETPPINLSGNIPVDDSSPAWSANGEQIAFRRKEFEGERASAAKQIWVMDGNGANQRPITTDLEYDHGQPVWSPDGRYLLFHRFPLKGPDIVLSIWIADVASGQTWEIVSPGQRPVWLP
ncbi:MAG: Ig-like domain-containing protein [Caldilineaceae bacterium]